MQGMIREERVRPFSPLRKGKRVFARAVIALVAGIGLVGVPAAQGTVDRTFHVYVDPIHGENSQAWLLNPAVAGSSQPLQTHPIGSANIPGILQHAPYSFRTLSGAQGAVQYSRQWVNFVQNGAKVAFVIIHCMPGLYGPLDPTSVVNGEEFDMASGLPWNGETFPIELPEGVSVQGTSALDTIFDARGYRTGVIQGYPIDSQTIFWFRSPLSQQPRRDFTKTFIDSIALRGCRGAPTGPLFGAAILIGVNEDNQSPCSPRITNCFIYGNYVGITMWASVIGSAALHRPWIVNNTIAWNQCGIYSASAAGTGWNEPIIHNNIIDRMIPGAPGLPAYFGGLGPAGGSLNEPAAFEGIAGPDLVASIPTAPGCAGGVLGSNFNAYDPQGADQQIFGYGPGTSAVPRPGGLLPSFPLPLIDLMPVTGLWNGGSPTRGELYVRDVLFAAGITAAPHDFRLAPTTRLNTVLRVGADGNGFGPNMLVNRGMSLANGALRFVNIGIHLGTPTAQDISAPPGIPNDRNATFHAFDWDCEGFGNPREAPRRFGQFMLVPQPNCASMIDLGADEMGELIITGYLDSTRILSRPHANVAPNTAGIFANDKFYFLNMPVTNPNYIDPQFNLRTDSAPFVPPAYVASGPNWAKPEWFAQLGARHNPFLAENDPPPPFALTSGQFKQIAGSLPNVTVRHGLVDANWVGGAFTAYHFFTRSRMCDIGSHLLDDIQVLGKVMVNRDVDYAEYSFLHPTFGAALAHDIFECNPWYDQGDFLSLPQVNDNSWMYVKDPSGTLPSSLRNGTLNPPLTIFADPDQAATFPSSFLFRNGSHPILYWGAPTYTYQVGPNGLSGPNPTLAIPNLDWYGYRQNFEIYEPDSALWIQVFGVRPTNNLQTMLVVQSEFVDPENPIPGDSLTATQREERRAAVSERMQLQARRR